MNRIVWKISLLSLGMMLGVATAGAQTLFNGAPAVKAVPAIPVKHPVGLGNANGAGATVTVHFLVAEQNIVDHAQEYCAELGKGEACEQAFRDCAFGEDNSFGCELSPLQSPHDDGTKDYACDQEETTILSACEARVAGVPNLAPRLAGHRVLTPGQFQVIPTEPEGRNYIQLDPQDVRNRLIVDRISGGRKVFVPAPVDGAEAAPAQAPQDEAGDDAQVEAAPSADSLQGAGCSLAATLTGGSNPWEWVLLVFGLIPALRFRK